MAHKCGRLSGDFNVAPAAVFRDRSGKRLARRSPLQGLASSPTPDTQVRDACAHAILDHGQIASAVTGSLNDGMNSPPKKE